MSRYLKIFQVFDKYWVPICGGLILGASFTALKPYFIENVAGCQRAGPGFCMQPTIFTDDILFSERLSVHFNWIKKGDVISAKHPYKRKMLCKRIIGMPGDKIQDGLTTEIVPPGHVWWEGDNKDYSEDCRDYGAVPQSLIYSRVRVALRRYPLSIL